MPGVTNVPVSSPLPRWEEAGAGQGVLDMDFVVGMRAAGAALPATARTSLCLLLPVTPGGWAEERTSGCYTSKFSLSLLFLLCGRGLCQRRRCEGVGGV